MSFPRYQHAVLGTAWKIAKGRFGPAPMPLAVNLVLTYRCNLRCSYCEVWRDPTPEMSTESACQLIDELAAAGTERLGISGGEPMLRKDIGVLIRRAKHNGLTVNLVSNGLQLPRRIEELAGLDYLAISLDGPEPLHDDQRGKGTFRSTLDAIAAARDAGIDVWTTTVLTRHNVGHVADIIDLARRLKVRASFLPVMKEGLKARNADDLKPERRAFAAAMEQLIRESRRADTPLAMSPDLLRHYRDNWGADRVPPNRHGAWQGGHLPCRAGRLFCSIAPDGRVYPCTYLQHAAPGPNALELGFGEAIKRLVPPDCGGCWCDSFTESNLIFALRPGAILHTLRLLASPRRQSLSTVPPAPTFYEVAANPVNSVAAVKKP